MIKGVIKNFLDNRKRGNKARGDIYFREEPEVKIRAYCVLSQFARILKISDREMAVMLENKKYMSEKNRKYWNNVIEEWKNVRRKKYEK